MPLLSILVPIYNVAPWLEDCVESILSQDCGNEIEVILLDDASTDGSGALAASLADRHAGRVTLMAHEVNRGVSAARNSLLDCARGHHIWFIDPDDVMMSGVLVKLLGLLRQHDPDVLICDYSKDGREDISAFVGPAGSLERDRDALVRGVFRSRRLHTWLKIWRRDLWTSDIRFPLGRVFEDVATTPLLLLRAESYYYVPEPWIFYRFRPASILTSVRGGRFDSQKHNDYVDALTGLKEAVAVPEISPETRFHISYFIAKEFTKIGYRLLKSSIRQPDLRPIGPTIRYYFLALDQRAPIPFEELAGLYLQRRKLIPWAVLRYFLYRARAPRQPALDAI